MKHVLAIFIAASLALPTANAQAVNCATPGADNAFLGIQTIRLWPGTPPEAKGDTCDDIPALTVFEPHPGTGEWLGGRDLSRRRLHAPGRKS